MAWTSVTGIDQRGRWRLRERGRRGRTRVELRLLLRRRRPGHLRLGRRARRGADRRAATCAGRCSSSSARSSTSSCATPPPPAARRALGLASYLEPCPAGSALDILVVDDDAPLRDMLTRSFEREGHRVTAVADGARRARRGRRGSFDVVLLDVALGAGPAGHDVARALRARRDVVPIIMLTALDSEADASRAWRPAPTTTSPSRSGWPSCAAASAPCCAAPHGPRGRRRRRRGRPRRARPARARGDRGRVAGAR